MRRRPHRHSRLALLLGGLAVVLSGLGTLGFALRARAFELTAGSASELLQLTELRALGGQTSLQLNGSALALTVGSTREGVAGVLDRFAQRCRKHTGQLAASIVDQLGRRRRTIPDPQWLEPIVRFADERNGWSACFDLGRDAIDARELLGRLRHFLGGGDVSEVGRLRVLWAARSTATTRVISIESHGPLPL